MTAQHPADALDTLLAGAVPELGRLTDAEVAWHPGPDIWSAKEILGHLIDSSANNHARFVGGALAPGAHYPGYPQSEWVAVNGYGHRDWHELVTLWAAYQRQLVHLLRGVPPHAWDHALTVRGEPLTLGALARGYTEHTRQHLTQIQERCREARQALATADAADREHPVAQMSGPHRT